MHTKVSLDKSIVKYTGRPIFKNELVDAVEKILNGEKRVVLSYGA
jgi:2-oxoglutarate ferredoxin oxidoreductase subunit alpha